VKNRTRIVAFLGMGLLLLGCDPGVSYRPASWAKAAPYRWRSSPVEGLDFATSGVAALVGATGLSPEFTVTNHTTEPVILFAGVLRTRSGQYDSVSIPAGQEPYFTAGPGESKRITLSFRLPQAAGDILLDPVLLRLRLKHGPIERVIDIPFVRD
jgi:hypothetical protein